MRKCQAAPVPVQMLQVLLFGNGTDSKLWDQGFSWAVTSSVVPIHCRLRDLSWFKYSSLCSVHLLNLRVRGVRVLMFSFGFRNLKTLKIFICIFKLLLVISMHDHVFSLKYAGYLWWTLGKTIRGLVRMSLGKLSGYIKKIPFTKIFLFGRLQMHKPFSVVCFFTSKWSRREKYQILSAHRTMSECSSASFLS